MCVPRPRASVCTEQRVRTADPVRHGPQRQVPAPMTNGARIFGRGEPVARGDRGRASGGYTCTAVAVVVAAAVAVVVKIQPVKIITILCIKYLFAAARQTHVGRLAPPPPPTGAVIRGGPSNIAYDVSSGIVVYSGNHNIQENNKGSSFPKTSPGPASFRHYRSIEISVFLRRSEIGIIISLERLS